MAIVIRSGMSLGATSAEDDDAYLSNCFVETPEVEALLDVRSPKSVVVGRTGSGKSALLKHLEDHSANVIRIDPESLALNFISNSNIIQVFEKLEIKLDVFYQLLWRHVLSVELIKTKKACMTSKEPKLDSKFPAQLAEIEKGASSSISV